MSSSIDRALEICSKLEAAGVRATTDPSALNLPAILVPPPRRRFDLGCGYTAVWGLRAIAPAPTGGDRIAWGILDELVDTIAATLPAEDAIPYGFPLFGQLHPSYLVTFTEAI